MTATLLWPKLSFLINGCRFTSTTSKKRYFLKDFQEVLAAVRNLRASGGALGAQQLCQECQSFEELIYQGKHLHFAEKLDRIIDAFQQASLALENLRSQLDG